MTIGVNFFYLGGSAFLENWVHPFEDIVLVFWADFQFNLGVKFNFLKASLFGVHIILLLIG